MTDSPIIVALDFSQAEDAVRMARRVEPYVGGFKIGLELLTGPGPTLIAALRQLGKPIFVDAKLHDIPNTVEKAARQLGRAGARWITAHAAGGVPMLEAAVAGLREGVAGGRAGILAITVLTSLDEAELARIGSPFSPGRLTARRARLAAEAGTEGVVCSVKELGVVAEVAPGLLKVTPGIRPAGEKPDDQKRTALPTEALARGSDLLVIGRSITRAANPEKAAAGILEGLASDAMEK